MKRVMAILLSVSLLFLPYGCSTMNMSNTQGGALTGAVTGAGLGALAGAIAGNGSTKSILVGTAIGLAAGALAGAIIGNYMDKKQKTAVETASAYQYQPREGLVVKMEDVRVEPEAIQPGGSSRLVMKYALLDPDSNKNISVVERRHIVSGSDVLKEIGPKAISRNSGTYYSEQEVTFPKNLPEGKYALKGIVEAEGKTTSQETYFRVTRIPTDSGDRYVYVFEKY